LEAEAAQLRLEIKGTELSKFRNELNSRTKVLRRMGHVDDNDVVQLKGRAAAEVTSGEELLVTELMFNGQFGRVVIENMDSIDIESSNRVRASFWTCTLNVSRARSRFECFFSVALRGLTENKHSTDVASPRSPPRVHMTIHLEGSPPR